MGKRFLVLIFGLTLSVVWQTHGVEAVEKSHAESNRSLEGLRSVYLKIEVMSPDMRDDLRKHGLTEDFLIASISNRLQDAGMILMNDQEYRNSAVKGLLLLRLQILKPVTAKAYNITEEGIKFSTPVGKVSFLYAIQIDLYQSVQLARSPERNILAATWQAGSSNIKPLADIRAEIRRHMDQFLLEFHSENRSEN